MSTSLFCAGAGAALTAAPSARGGGERRLPGCGAAAASAGGFRGVGFITFTGCLSMAAPAPPCKPKVTKLACAKKATGELPEWSERDEYSANIGDYKFDTSSVERLRSFGDEDDEFDKYYAVLCDETEAMLSGGLFVFKPIPISEEETALQNNLKEIAEMCMGLQADAMRRLRPEQRRPMYLLFRATHLAFASVKAKATEGQANWGVSSLLIVHKLDVVRRMVSSACGAPLPLDTGKQKQVSSLLPLLVKEAILGLAGATANSNNLPPVVPFALVEFTYNTVKSDIDKMITASDATSTSASS